MVTLRVSSKQLGHIFILWSDGFDEAAAAIFATVLRQAGLAVKVVGLAGQQAAGLHRLLLGADLTLGAALQIAHRATGVILPCTPATVRRIDNDPRVDQLLQEACTNDALFVIQQTAMVDDPLLANLPIAKGKLVGYGEANDLIAFAHSLALTLANHR